MLLALVPLRALCGRTCDGAAGLMLPQPYDASYTVQPMGEDFSSFTSVQVPDFCIHGCI